MQESEAKKLLQIGEACVIGLDIGLEESYTTITYTTITEVRNWLEGFPDRVLESNAREVTEGRRR